MVDLGKAKDRHAYRFSDERIKAHMGWQNQNAFGIYW